MSTNVSGIEVKVYPTHQSRLGTMDFENIQFGRVFSDHQFVADFVNGEWQDLRIEKYGEVPMSMAISALHYGQSIFEGMKAQKTSDGSILLFRPFDNLKRLNKSAARMCMPALSEEVFIAGLTKLLQLDNEWIPTKQGSGLYIRPFMFATDAFIGVRPSDTYRFSIFTCPVNAYYQQPLSVKVESHYVRASDGGVGFAKCAGNYGSQMLATKEAQAQGYTQVLWTDAIEHKYIEETGTTNVFVRFGDKVVTPAIDGTILEGITRDSVITLLRHWGVTVEERKVAIDEIIDGIKNGSVKEIFATGTAATLVPIVSIGHNNDKYELNGHDDWEFANKLSNILSGIKNGIEEDVFGWIVKI